MSNQIKVKILFLCTGNICRSPMANAIFQHKMNLEKYKYPQQIEFSGDSAGTGLIQKFQKADERTQKVLKGHGISCDHFARNVEFDDFLKFDTMFCMDKKNLTTVSQLMKQFTKQQKKENINFPNLLLMRKYDYQNPNSDVPDPYFLEQKNFQEVFNILNICIDNFIQDITKPLSSKG